MAGYDARDIEDLTEAALEDLLGARTDQVLGDGIEVFYEERKPMYHRVQAQVRELDLDPNETYEVSVAEAELEISVEAPAGLSEYWLQVKVTENQQTQRARGGD